MKAGFDEHPNLPQHIGEGSDEASNYGDPQGFQELFRWLDGLHIHIGGGFDAPEFIDQSVEPKIRLQWCQYNVLHDPLHIRKNHDRSNDDGHN